jgi:uncharacterized membrane protein
MKAKLFVILMASLVLCAGAVSAANLQISSVQINGHTLQSTDTSTTATDYQRGQDLNLDVCVLALADVENAQVLAFIPGYDFAIDEPSKISDMTDTFNLKEGHEDCFSMSLQVPTKIDVDYFKLRITAEDRDGESILQNYELYLKGISKRKAIEIKDFSLDPQEVIAGRAFTGKVQIHNLADSTVNDLKLTMSIPSLNLKVSEYMDSIDSDKTKTFEELLLRIPECTKAGNYDVEMLVEFNSFSETQSLGQITVQAGDTCGIAGTTTGTPAENTVVSVPNLQEVTQGTSVVYPVVINNAGGTSQTYTLSVTGASTWSTTRIDPSAVIVVPAGQSKTAYLYVSTNDNAELGDKVFTLNIDSGSDTKSVPLVAKITKSTTVSDWSGFKNALQIGLVILVVILIIVGLVIGFNKMKDNKQETEPYY